MKRKIVSDDYLFLLERELAGRKAVRTVLKEQVLHEDQLILDIERQITEYNDSKQDNTKDIKKHLE